MSDGPELDASTREVIKDGDEVTERAAETIQLPNHEGVPRLELGETLGQFRTTTIRPRCRFDKDGFTPSFLKSEDLKIGFLVRCGHASIAINHGYILDQYTRLWRA